MHPAGDAIEVEAWLDRSAGPAEHQDRSDDVGWRELDPLPDARRPSPLFWQVDIVAGLLVAFPASRGDVGGVAFMLVGKLQYREDLPDLADLDVAIPVDLRCPTGNILLASQYSFKAFELTWSTYDLGDKVVLVHPFRIFEPDRSPHIVGLGRGDLQTRQGPGRRCFEHPAHLFFDFIANGSGGFIQSDLGAAAYRLRV